MTQKLTQLSKKYMFFRGFLELSSSLVKGSRIYPAHILGLNQSHLLIKHSENDMSVCPNYSADVFQCVCVCVRPSLTQAVGAVYREAHEDDVCIWVGQGPQSVIVLLT